MSKKNIVKLFISIGICELAGVVGSFFTAPAISSWYAGLVKPEINPPGWVFGPVWTLLYLLMGIALFLVWKRGFKERDSKIGLLFFALQLVLNSLWSIIFFGSQNPGLALVEIIIFWLAILLTIIYFFRVSKWSAILLLPYLLWVSLAIYLNYSIWLLN